eukprot:CAMPEP_0201912458 /NCGR_PEP_ID=MMETSP0903-20130614/3123_1 /ASSEMBLY_ACC=CAM_ASM_000552 /TAXON_ID=420261 /ORGANISM="Thalassiosira antarctica, Strain CCMP982" /LENGTH=627 /DNA_ID=CAMNT_0048447423 /DNA_START=30 /DNA_END=1910 /DNA_ORIENTATION=+
MPKADMPTVASGNRLSFGRSGSNMRTARAESLDCQWHQANNTDTAATTTVAADTLSVSSSSTGSTNTFQYRPASSGTTLSFGKSTSNMRTGSISHRTQSLEASRNQSSEYSLAAAVVDMEDCGISTTGSVVSFGNSTTSGSTNTFQYRPAPTKSALKQSTFTASKSSTPSNKKAPKLAAISKMYDLDGDGELDEAEQIIRDCDVTGRGHLSNDEIKTIVKTHLSAEEDVHLYKRVARGLVCLVAILALSNFGSSWASAILAKEVTVESESGTIRATSSGEVVGFQDVAFTVELDPLTDEEFEERRALVEAEMMKDVDHEYHLHRRLGRKEKNHCTCSKIAYDHGKIRERDLLELTYKCDGVKTVNIKRKWRNRDGYDDFVYDNICGPGTTIVRRGKRKRNKHKTKVKVVDIKVTFRQKGKNGRDKSISFDCNRGNCYGSGGTLLQREGHPCQLERDYDGAGECDEGLVCYDSDGDTHGVGVCTNLVKYARKNQVCDIDFGVNACTANYACSSTKNGRNSQVKVGTVRTGICQRVVQRSGYNEVCDVSFGANACLNDYRCLGANGRDIGRVGIGFCTRSEVTVNDGGDGGWYVDYSLGAQGQCVNDGNAETWEETWATANECCDKKLW